MFPAVVSVCPKATFSFDKIPLNRRNWFPLRPVLTVSEYIVGSLVAPVRWMMRAAVYKASQFSTESAGLLQVNFMTTGK